MIRVFLLDTHAISDETVNELFKTMPMWRQEDALRCRRPPARRQSILSFCLARYAILQTEPSANAAQWLHGTNGKPTLVAGHPFFNISHTAHGIAVAVSTQGEVGIDTEEIRPHSDRLAARVCAEDEMHLILTAPDPCSAFIRLWTVKEAVVKQRGSGIEALGNLRHISLDGVQSTQILFGGIPHWLSVSPTDEMPPLTFVNAEQL